jgi:predicted ATPase
VAEGVSRFEVLGPLTFEREGEVVPLPSGRQRSLLALLLQAGGVPLSRDRLIDELWGERPPASAVSALHVHLSKLRNLLDGLLVLETSGYALAPQGFELDVWHFDELVERARADPGNAGVLLGEALALVRGEPLCDVACEGTVSQWRRALEEKLLQAVMLRLDTDLAAGAAGELVAELERLVAAHPFEERLWGQLMVALYRSGRQADALDSYQRARRRFVDELGLEPGDALVQLQRRILDADSTLRLTVDAAPARRTAGSNLPRPTTRLVGRDRELTALEDLLADPDVRLLTLAGPGGVGKTRLLIEIARRHEPDYADGAVFARLERLTDAAQVAAEIATALGKGDAADAPSADGLANYLREREVLVVIDNFEHLLPAAVLIAELLEQAPHIRVLVSSRMPLRIRGEHVFELEPLELPVGDSGAELSQSPAVQLFLQCALASNRKLDVDMGLVQTVAGICRALDGLPLAIELAASRSQLLSPTEIAAQLADPLSIGEHALRDLPDRQQTLEATIDWSYDLLGEEARAVLRRAGVFLGGFSLEALEAVTGSPARSRLDELLDASLVRRQSAAGRFELLELVRAFALDALSDAGELPDARARERRYFAADVASASEGFDEGGSPGELAAPLMPDHANLRSALEDAIEQRDEQSALGLALALRPVWFASMLRVESQELVGRMLDTFTLGWNDEVRLLRAVSFVDGFGQAAGTWTRRLAKRAEEVGDAEAMTMAVANLFGQALNERDRDEMARLRPSLVALLNPEASPRALGWTHYFLALDAYVDGRFEAALEHSALSVEDAVACGHDFMHASAVATRLLARSAKDEGIRCADLAQALELMRRPSVQPMAAFALWLVARYAAGVEPETAGRWLAHAERILDAIDSKLWPESLLRDETMAVLALSDLAPLLEATAPLDDGEALDEAVAWLAARDPAEISPREGALGFVTATG